MNISQFPRTGSEDITVGASQYEAGSIGVAALTDNLIRRRAGAGPQTVTTTGAVEFAVRAPCAGTIASIAFYGKDTLATNDTNYVTFTAINYVSGAGSTALLSTADTNTSKATGGAACTAHTTRGLVLTATAGNLVVASGDLLVVVVTPTGTLANTITFAGVSFNITPS